LFGGGGGDDASGDDATVNDEGGDDLDGTENDDAFADDDTIDRSYDFDLGNCTSYSDYWLWDLALTCDNSQNLTNCECTSAALLMSDGEFGCPDGDEAPYCPSSCKICDTCLTLLGCPETRPNVPTGGDFNMSLLVYILAGVAGVLLGVIAMMVHKNGEPAKPLEENLVAGNSDDNVWLAPVS